MKADAKRDRHPAPAGSPNLVWCYFNKGDDHEGVLLQSDKAGAYFESAVEPVVGSTILMRRTAWNSLPRQRSWNSPSVALATVEQCQEADSRQRFPYRVTIKYHEYY